jgi:hypothetical protein
MKRILLAAVLATFGASAEAGVLYQHAPDPNGGLYHSSWWDPDGSNYDEYVWDKFVLAFNADVDTIAWRGAYDGAAGGPVVNFTVGIYASIPGGSQPDVGNPPLMEYEVGGNAGETFAGVVGGVTTYDYRYALPAAFPAQAGVPYWVQIEAWQWGFPDWSLIRGTGGDGSHFRCQHLTAPARLGVPTGCWFTTMTGDTTFRLLTATATDVDPVDGPAELVLRGALPNPSRGDRLDVSFSLPNGALAELVLYDVAGRRVTSEEVGRLGAGSHVVDLAARTSMAPGIYFARLSQGGTSQLVKVVVTR